MSVDANTFKNALSRFASGVTVVTAEVDGEAVGITVSAFISVSLEPPLILVSISKKARAHEALAKVDRFGVSVLAAGQEAVSNYFAGWKEPGQTVELARPGGSAPEMGAPMVPDALAWIDCSKHQAVEAGDHTLYIGRVEHVTVSNGEPLLWFRSKYRTTSP